MKRVAIGLLLLLWLAPALAAEDPEIDFLLTAVEQSDCTFIRNGKRHASDKAAEHLRMKYGRAKWAVDDADDFIDRIATKSSMSGRLYTIQCGDDEPAPTRDWLRARLTDYRQGTGPDL